RRRRVPRSRSRSPRLLASCSLLLNDVARARSSNRRRSSISDVRPVQSFFGRGSAMPDVPDFRARDVVLDDGLNIHYFHKAGRELNLVLLHPSSGYGRMWELTAGYLDPRFSVYAPDQRGHGDSGRPDGEYSAEELAKDLKAVVDKLGLKRIVV